MKKRKEAIKQLISFGLVGGTSFLLDIIVTTVLYDYAHFPAYLAAGIGFISAFFFNFPINRKHVFSHSKHDRFTLKTQMILYVLLLVFNLLMTGLVMELLVASHLLKVAQARFVVVAVIAAWNFLLYKKLIFSKRKIEEYEGSIIQ